MKEKKKISIELILSVISNMTRLDILKLLSQENLLAFNEIMLRLDLSPEKDTGKFGYHLRTLLDANLIDGGAEYGYTLTNIGEKVVEFINSVNQIINTEPKIKPQFPVRELTKDKISVAIQKESNINKDIADNIAKIVIDVYRMIFKNK